MAWTTPAHSREEINRAGEFLIARPPRPWSLEYGRKRGRAIEVVNNWRAVHACPLQTIKMALAGRAQKVELISIVSQRTKRIPAIILKLRKNHEEGKGMKLSQMHDIGGCRAILGKVSQVEELVRIYERATSKNPTRGGIFHRKYDYIKEPKPTGYRGIHLVYKYHSDSKKLKIYNDLKIEIQIRSKLQHYWATAVETVDFFTGQALKSNIGELSWKRFFILVSNEFARLEKQPLVPGAPIDENESKLELKSFSKQISALEGFQTATNIVTKVGSSPGGDQLFLLQLNLDDKTIGVIGYSRDKSLEALEAYTQAEETNKDNPSMQTVLVSVDSLSALKKAYPSFYLDISEFVKVLNKILGIYPF